MFFHYVSVYLSLLHSPTFLLLYSIAILLFYSIAIHHFHSISIPYFNCFSILLWRSIRLFLSNSIILQFPQLSRIPSQCSEISPSSIHFLDILMSSSNLIHSIPHYMPADFYLRTLFPSIHTKQSAIPAQTLVQRTFGIASHVVEMAESMVLIFQWRYRSMCWDQVVWMFMKSEVKFLYLNFYFDFIRVVERTPFMVGR